MATCYSEPKAILSKMFWCSAMVVVHTALLLSTEGNSLCASYDDICSNTSRFVGFLSTASSCPLASEHTSPVLSHMPPHEYCCLSQQQRQLVSQSSCNQMVCWSGVIIINMAVMADTTDAAPFFLCHRARWFFPSKQCGSPHVSIPLSLFLAASFFPCLPLLLFHTNQSYSFILFFSCSCSLKNYCRIEYIFLSLSCKGRQLVSWTVWSLNKKPLMPLKSSTEIRFSCLPKICLSFLVSHKVCESFSTSLLSRSTVCRQKTIVSLL